MFKIKIRFKLNLEQPKEKTNDQVELLSVHVVISWQSAHKTIKYI